MSCDSINNNIVHHEDKEIGCHYENKEIGEMLWLNGR